MWMSTGGRSSTADSPIGPGFAVESSRRHLYTRPVADASLKTLSGRRARISARREAWLERDADRYRLAEEFAGRAQVSIPPEDGFVVLPPGRFEGAEAVVAAANELIDGIGHDELMSKNTKDGFMAKGFLPESAFQLDSPYMRFILGEDVIGAVSRYLGLVPVLNRVDVWYSAHAREAPKSSQRWHLDSADTTQVKVWIHLSDVGPASGPLTVVGASTSEQVADEIGYDFGEGHRVPDERFLELAGPSVTALEGPTGTVHFVDTSRCFHFGSRVDEGGTPRRVFMVQYLTPYAFRFKSDHVGRAPFKELVSDDASELKRLLLGVS